MVWIWQLFHHKMPGMSEKILLVKVGKKIRDLRKAARMSQEEFALQIEMGSSSFGRIERGEQNTTLLNLAKIAKALDVRMGALLPDSDDTA